MNFKEALKQMKRGYSVKLPSWKGYWAWEDGTIMMYTKDFERIPLLKTERPEYTFNNIASDDFEKIDWLNNPVKRAWDRVSKIREELDALPLSMVEEKDQGYANLSLLLSGTPMKARKEECYWTCTDGKPLTLHISRQKVKSVGIGSIEEAGLSSPYPHKFYDYIPANSTNCSLLDGTVGEDEIVERTGSELEADAMHEFVKAYMTSLRRFIHEHKNNPHKMDLFRVEPTQEELEQWRLAAPFRMDNLWRYGCRDI